MYLGGCRTAVVDEKFFVSYRKVAMETNEVLISIFIPFTAQVCSPTCRGRVIVRMWCINVYDGCVSMYMIGVCQCV